MSLRRALRSGVAAACIAGVAVPTGYAVPAVAARPALEVRLAQAEDFTRLEFHWAGGARVTSRREGQVLVLRFSRDAKPDIALIRAAPPRWLKAAEARRVGGALEIVLTLAEDADAKVGQADGATYVNLFEKKEAPPAPPAPAPEPEVVAGPPPPPRPDPTPVGGVVPVVADVSASQTRLRFDWRAPLGAAVFRRGEAVWVVFDAPGRLDVARLPKGGDRYRGVQAVHGKDYAALRLVVPRNMPVTVAGEGASWTLAIGAGPPAGREQTGGGSVSVARDSESAQAGLTATMAGAGRLVWVDDPAVGDRLAVVPALAPNKGLTTRRDFVDLAMLATIHGLAIESYAPGLGVAVEGDLVRIGKAQGLALSPSWAGDKAQTAAILGAPAKASMPGMIDGTWAQTGEGGFMRRYDQLLAEAAAETNKGKDAPTEARMALARFLVGSELSYEAIGVLNAASRSRETLMGDAEFRGLRGAARVMAGRLKEADSDLSVGVLADDPSSAAWRGYIAARQGEWADARAKFGQAARAMELFPALWQARFMRADAEAAIALGDFAGAQDCLRRAAIPGIPQAEELANRLMEARLLEARGDKDRALSVYELIAKAPLEQYAAPALLRATQIKLDQGKITPVDAVRVFDGLRYRWRGDATELETVRLLGKLYMSQGRYREGLEALRSAGTRLPDLPAAVDLQNDLSAAFRALFLEGLADGLEPIQALGLYNDFKDLTPIGAEGDLMVRKMARRLVDVDLLDQAADLLKYQVENRLDGVPKAQVATDLALIYLMNRQPEQALSAINNSRTTVLPAALNAERRIITARALMGLGRLDAAEEVIESDTSAEATDVRAEIAWKARNWPLAGELFEKQLADRWKSPQPLRSDEEGRLLRAGVAFSLAGDEAALTRMRERFSPLFEAARNPEALKVAFADMDDGRLTTADFGRSVADSEAFNGWVAKMKQKFREKPAPVGTAKAPESKAAPARG
ncbi:MAG TPA: endoglucanase [Caulobacter sp.]|nr:endoglucanase [Caulobacter sp.]